MKYIAVCRIHVFWFICQINNILPQRLVIFQLIQLKEQSFMRPCFSLTLFPVFLKFQAEFAQRLMGALVKRRKDSSNPRVFPEELKEVKIVGGGTNDTPTTLRGFAVQVKILQKKTKKGISAAAVSFSDASECGIIGKGKKTNQGRRMFTLQEVKSLMLIFDLLKERKHICIGKHLTRLDFSQLRAWNWSQPLFTCKTNQHKRDILKCDPYK
ncbi:hypothetical protein EK904_007098 [Melospiza melodia maxima]|nr:hypothetical protein EK904_007098 [Melospiza melodia maxima]